MLAVPDGLSERGRAFFRGKARSQKRRKVPDVSSLPAALREVALELDAVWGGVQLGNYTLGLTAGPGEQMPRVREVEDKPVVLFGVQWHRDPFYVDADGRLYARQGWWPEAPLFLTSGSVMLLVERLALADWLTSRPVAAELDRRRARAVAGGRGLPSLEGASGEDSSFWGTPEPDGLFLCDGQPFAPAREVTSVQGPRARVAEALLCARRLDPDAGARIFLFNPRNLNAGDQHPPTEVKRPDEAPPLPPLGERVLPLRARTAMRWERDRLQGVIDLSDDAVTRMLETHDGAVLVETRFTDAGLTRIEHMAAADRVAPLLSEHGRHGLSLTQVTFDPRDVLPAEETAAFLRKLGIAEPDRMVAVEQLLGGLRFGDDLWGLHLGVYPTLRTPLERDEEGAGSYTVDDGRVDFGYEGDGRYLLDVQGRLHFVDDIDGTDILLAETPQMFLERRFRGGAGLEPSAGPDFRVAAYVGGRIAEALQIPPVPELTDAAERMWMDGLLLIHELPAREGEVMTKVTGADMRALAAAVEVLAGEEAVCLTRYTDVRLLLEEGGLTVERQTGESWWEDPVSAEARALATRIRGVMAAEELPSVAGHEAAVVRRAVAERDDASLAVLAAVVDATGLEGLDELVVLDAVARHPAADAALLQRLAVLAPPPPLSEVVRRAVAMHGAIDAALLQRLGSDDAPQVRQAAALNPEAPPALIARLCQDEDAFVRRTAAEHPRAPAEALGPLATDPDQRVKLAVASNPSTPDAALRVLAADPDPSVAYNLAKRPAVPADVAARVAYHPWALRNWTASNPAVPVEALRDLSVAPERDCRRGIARNPATPPELLVSLLNDGDPETRQLALGHPSLPGDAVPPELRSKLEEARRAHPLVAGDFVGPATLAPTVPLGTLADHRSPFRGGWAGHPTYPVGLLADVVDDPEILVGLAVSGHPWVPSDVLELLSLHRYTYARRAVAAHPRTPPAVVEALSRDESGMVRAAAAASRHLPIELLDALSSDEDKEVREGVGRHPGCPLALLERLATDDHEYVRRAVADNLRAPAELLARLAADPHIQVRSRLPLNPGCPDEVVQRLLTDKERIVRDAAIWRSLDHAQLSKLIGATA